MHHFDSQILEWADKLAMGNNPFGDVSDEKVKEIYALAYLLYSDRHFQEASHFFRNLILARPAEPKYWKGLGACLQMLKEYDEAIDCYTSAQILKGKEADPYIYLHTADCYFALKDVQEAFKAIKTAEQLAKKNHNQQILGHVKLMHELWEVPL